MTVVTAFPSSDVCRICHIGPSTLQYWVLNGLVKPSVVGPGGHRYERWWSVEDVLEVRAIKALRDAGCPLQRVRAAKAELGGMTATMRDKRLVWDGNDLFLLTWGQLEKLVRNPGQLALALVVLPVSDWARELRGSGVCCRFG